MERGIVNRREFLKLSALGGMSMIMSCSLPVRHSVTTRPNIIFILTDDQGWGDGKHFGHPYMKTPNIDRLGTEGAWFKQFYVASPVCSPSRVAFMTGHYPVRHSVHHIFSNAKNNSRRGMPDWLDPEATTVCDILKSAGYMTGHFGKWHLSSGKNAPSPSEYGIDDHRTRHSTGPGWEEEERSDPYFRAKSTGLFVDETIRFIRESVSREKSFYVNLWTMVPHAKLNPTPEELEVYKDLEITPEDFTGYMRDYLSKSEDMTGQMKVFCAAMTGLDKAIGRLLDFLDDTGLADTTIVFFSSDNGPEDYHLKPARNAGVGNTGVFRARKRSLYEGGIRTPLVVRWPKHVKAGRVDEQSVMASVDFLPTVCNMARVPLPDIKPDGEDVSDILLGESRQRRKAIFWEYKDKVHGEEIYKPPSLAIREGDWKLFVNPDGSGKELYNIVKDPEQKHTIADQNPDVVNRLLPKLMEWKKSIPE